MSDYSKIEDFEDFGYQSPISIMMPSIEQITEDFDKHVMRVVHKIDVNVDEDELVKALQYDRDQYEKGYRDGCNSVATVERPRWIPVTERLPENDVHVLLSCECGAGSYVCDGFHTAKYSTPTQFYEDIDADYDEETDEYYFPEGWWEVIKNWDDYSCVLVEDTVTHWMPLPEPPAKEEDQ